MADLSPEFIASLQKIAQQDKSFNPNSFFQNINSNNSSFANLNKFNNEEDEDKEMSLDEQLKKQKEDKESRQTREMTGLDWLFGKAGQIAESIMGASGMDRATARIEQEGLNPGNALELGGAFLKSIPTMMAGAPFDVAAKGYEAITGKPVSESHDDFMAKEDLNSEQRLASGGQALLFGLGMVPGWGGTGKGIAGLGKVAKAAATGEEAGAAAFKAGQAAFEAGGKGLTGLARDVGINVAEGAGIGALGAVRGDQDIWENGGPSTEDILSGAGTGAMQGAAMGLFGKAVEKLTGAGASPTKNNIKDKVDKDFNYDDPVVNASTMEKVGDDDYRQSTPQDERLREQSSVNSKRDNFQAAVDKANKDPLGHSAALTSDDIRENDINDNAQSVIAMMNHENYKTNKGGYSDRLRQRFADELGLDRAQIDEYADNRDYDNFAAYVNPALDQAYREGRAFQVTLGKQPGTNDGPLRLNLRRLTSSSDRRGTASVHQKVLSLLNADTDGDLGGVDYSTERIKQSKTIYDFHMLGEKSNMDWNMSSLGDLVKKNPGIAKDAIKYALNKMDEESSNGIRSSFRALNPFREDSLFSIARRKYNEVNVQGYGDRENRRLSSATARKFVNEWSDAFHADDSDERLNKYTSNLYHDLAEWYASKDTDANYNMSKDGIKQIHYNRAAQDMSDMFGHISDYVVQNAQSEKVNDQINWSIKAQNFDDVTDTAPTLGYEGKQPNIRSSANYAMAAGGDATNMLPTEGNTFIRIGNLMKMAWKTSKFVDTPGKSFNDFLDKTIRMYFGLNMHGAHVAPTYETEFADAVLYRAFSRNENIALENSNSQVVIDPANNSIKDFKQSLIDSYNEVRKAHNSAYQSITEKGKEEVKLPDEFKIKSKATEDNFDRVMSKILTNSTDGFSIRVRDKVYTINELLQRMSDENKVTSLTEIEAEANGAKGWGTFIEGLSREYKSRQQNIAKNVADEVSRTTSDLVKAIHTGSWKEMLSGDSIRHIDGIKSLIKWFDNIVQLIGGRAMNDYDFIQNFWSNKWFAKARDYMLSGKVEQKEIDNAIKECLMAHAVADRFGEAQNCLIKMVEAKDSGLMDEAYQWMNKAAELVTDVVKEDTYCAEKNVLHARIEEMFYEFKNALDDGTDWVERSDFDAKFDALANSFNHWLEVSKDTSWDKKVENLLAREYGKYNENDVVLGIIRAPGEDIKDMQMTRRLLLSKYNLKDASVYEMKRNSDAIEENKALINLIDTSGDNDTAVNAKLDYMLATSGADYDEQVVISCGESTILPSAKIAEKAGNTVEANRYFNYASIVRNASLKFQEFMSRYVTNVEGAITESDLMSNNNLLRDIIRGVREVDVQFDDHTERINRVKFFNRYLTTKVEKPEDIGKAQWKELLEKCPKISMLFKKDVVAVGDLSKGETVVLKQKHDTIRKLYEDAGKIYNQGDDHKTFNDAMLDMHIRSELLNHGSLFSIISSYMPYDKPVPNAKELSIEYKKAVRKGFNTAIKLQQAALVGAREAEAKGIHAADTEVVKNCIKDLQQFAYNQGDKMFDNAVRGTNGPYKTETTLKDEIAAIKNDLNENVMAEAVSDLIWEKAGGTVSGKRSSTQKVIDSFSENLGGKDSAEEIVRLLFKNRYLSEMFYEILRGKTSSTPSANDKMYTILHSVVSDSLSQIEKGTRKNRNGQLVDAYKYKGTWIYDTKKVAALENLMQQKTLMDVFVDQMNIDKPGSTFLNRNDFENLSSYNITDIVNAIDKKANGKFKFDVEITRDGQLIKCLNDMNEDIYNTIVEAVNNYNPASKDGFNADEIIKKVNMLMVEKEINEMRTAQNREEFKFSAYDFFFNEGDGVIYDIINSAEDMYKLNKNKSEYAWMDQAVQNLKENNDWRISEGFSPFSNFNAIDAMRGKEQTATSNITTMTGVNGSLPKISWVVDIFGRVKPQRSLEVSKEALGGQNVDVNMIYQAILREMFIPGADERLIDPDNGFNQAQLTSNIFTGTHSLADSVDDVMDFRYINLDKQVQVNKLIANALNKSTKKIGEWIPLNEYNVKRILQEIQSNPSAIEDPANAFMFSRGYSRAAKNFNTMTKFLMETGLLKAKKNFTSKSTAVADRLFGNMGIALDPDTSDINVGDYANIKDLATDMLKRRDSWVDKFKKRIMVEVCANKLDYDNYDFVHKSNGIVSVDTEPFEIFCNRVQFQVKDPNTGESYYIHVGQKELDALANGGIDRLIVGNEEIPVESIINYRIEAEDPRMMFQRLERAGRRYIESKGGIDNPNCKSKDIYKAMINEWEVPNKFKNTAYRSISDILEEKDWPRYGKPNVGTWFNNSLDFQSMLNGLDRDYKMQKKLDVDRKNKYNKVEWGFVEDTNKDILKAKIDKASRRIVIDGGYVPQGIIQHDSLKEDGNTTFALRKLNTALESNKRNNADDPLLKASKYKNTIILDIEENENAATDIKNRIEDYFQYMNASNNIIIMSSKMFDSFESECKRLGISPIKDIDKVNYKLIGRHNEIIPRTGYVVNAREWNIKTQDEFGVNSSSIGRFQQKRRPISFVAVTNEIDRYPDEKTKGTKHYVSIGGSRMGESEILAMTDRHVISHAQTFKKDLSVFNRFQSDGAEMLEDPNDIAKVWNNQSKIIWDLQRPDEEIGQTSNANPANLKSLERYCTKGGFNNTIVSKDLEGARLIRDVHDGDCVGIIRYRDKKYNDWRYIPLFYDGSDIDYLGVNYGWASNSNTEVTITQMGSHRLTKTIAPDGWVEGGIDKGFFPELAAKGLVRAVDERITAAPFDNATGIDFDFQVDANTVASRAKGDSPLKTVSAPIKMFYQIVCHDCNESQFSLLEKIDTCKDLLIKNWNDDYANLFKIDSDNATNKATMSTSQRGAVQKLIGIINRLEDLDGKRIDKYTAKQIKTILSNCWAKNINPFIFLERKNWNNNVFWAPKEALMLHQVFGKDLATVTRTFQYLCKKKKSMRDIVDKDGRGIRQYDAEGNPVPPNASQPLLDPDFMWSKISGKNRNGWDWVRYEISLDAADEHAAFHNNPSSEMSFDIGQLYIRKLNGGGGDIKDFFRKSVVKNGKATYDELRKFYNIKPSGKNQEGRWQISSSAKTITLPEDYIEANFIHNINQWINPTKNHIKYVNMFRDYELKKSFSFYLPRKEGEYNVEGKTGTYMNSEFQKLLSETCSDLDWEPTSWNKYKVFRYILDAEGITGSTNNDAISWHILSEGATKIVDAKKNNRLIGFDETARFAPKGSYSETRFELPITEPTFLKEIADEQGMSYDDLVKQTQDRIYKTAREIIGYADNEKQKKLLLQNCAYKLEQLGVPSELITLYDDMTFWEMEDNLNQWANRAIPGFGGMKSLFQAQAMQREQIIATQNYEKNIKNKLEDSPTSKWGIRKARRDNHDVTLGKVFRMMSTLSRALGLPRIGILEQNAIDKPINYGSARLLINFGKKGIGPFKIGENEFRLDPGRQHDLIRSPEFTDVLTIDQIARFKGEQGKMILALTSGDKSAKEYLKSLNDKMTNFEKLYQLESRVFTAADVGKHMRNNNFVDLWIRTCYDKGYTAPFEIVESRIDEATGKRIDITRFEKWMANKSDAQIAVGMLYGDEELGVPISVGQAAWNLTLKGDLAQENVVTVFLEHAIKSSPFLDFLMTSCGNKYMRACTNTAGRSLQWVAPMSTFNYLAAKAFQSEAFMEAAKNHGWLKGFMETPEYFQMKMETAQVYNSLRQALMVDALHMTAPMLATMLAGAAFFEPPADDKKKCNYQEWTVCGMRIGQAWWLDDILGIAAPLAAFWKSAEMGQPDFSIFLNGMKKHLSSNPFAKVGDCFTALMEPDALAEEAEEICSRYDNAPQGKPDGIEYLVASLPAMGLNYASQFITPAFVKEFWDNFHQYETSYNRIYQTSPSGKLTEDGEYGSTVKTSFADAQIRKVTRNNVVLGTLLDILPTGSSTSYVGDKMPRTVINDPVQVTFMKKYSVNNEDGSEKSNDEKNAVAWQIITMLQNNPDTKALHDAGFYIDSATRKYVSEVLHDMYQYTKDDFNYRKEQGMLDYDVLGDGNYNLGRQRYQQFYNTYKEQLNFWNTLYKQRLWSKDLTQPMQGYNIYNTTYLQDKNGNFYATGFKEGLGGLISPITVAPEGNTAGREQDWASLSAVNGQPMFDENGNAMRGLVPVTQYTETPDIESWGTDNGYSANYGTSYSGSRSYGSRSGGSGGSIHAPSVNLNIGTPGTPRQSNLRSAQFDYLRPNYETQGSSRAYKRSSL